MTITRLMLFSFFWAFPACAVIGQTIFPEKPMSIVAESAPHLLDAEQTRQKIGASRSLLRDGKLWDAATLLANREEAVNLNGNLEPGLIHLTRALLEFHAGNLRAAEREAVAANEFSVQGDALLLRSLIYAKACVWSVSQQLLEQAKSWDPLHTAHDRQPALIPFLQELLTAHSGPEVSQSLDDQAPWEWLRGKHAGFRYMFDRQATAADRTVVIVYQFDSTLDFRAAVSLEPHDAPGQSRTWSMFLCDLEGPPLRVAARLKTRPTDQEFLTLVQSFNPVFGNETPNGRYTLLRAELEALAAYQQGILPLAARWADYAQTRAVQDQVITPLQEQRSAAWTLRDTSEFGPWQPYGHRMSGYVNDDFAHIGPVEVARAQALKEQNISPPEIGELMKGPIEHYHFVVGSRKPNLYCGSFAVASDDVEPGERVYFLKRIVQGRASVVETYASLPTFESVATEIRKFLQEAPVDPMTPSSEGTLRIEDRLESSDEVDARFQKGFRKEYRVTLAGGTPYLIDVTSPDFDAAVRIEDQQGKKFHEIEQKMFMEYLDRLLGKEGIRTGKYNSRVLFEAPRDGIYRIIATTFEKDKEGSFALTVQQQQRSR